MTTPVLKLNPKLQPVDTSKVDEGSNHDVHSDVAVLDKEVKQEEQNLPVDKFLQRSISAFDASDDWFKKNVLPRTKDALNAYNNKPTSTSLMGSDPDQPFIFRPKTRTVIQKYKSAALASFFSNLDMVSIEPENPSDKKEIITAAMMKQLINHRLRKTIPWVHISLGAFDDALTTGLCIGYIEWKYQEGSAKTIDQPFVDIVPLENMRWDPAADWSDIVNTSPYLVMLIPMYIGDLKDQMDAGKFIKLEDDQLAASMNPSSVSKERNPRLPDPQADQSQKSGITDYQTTLVQLHIHRIKGEDWIWYTLNNTAMLTNPRPLSEVHFHGKRPFIIGSTDIEPHNAFVTPFPELVAGMQDEMNILINQRRTNVDMAMNRKWLVDPAAGDELDPKSLLSNDPSMVFGPKDSVTPLTMPDVTQSAYEEQQVLDADFNEMAGNFNPAPSLASKTPQDTPFKTNQMLNSNANMLVDGRLKIFALTFIEPLLRLLAQLEQHYESDETLIGLVGTQAGIFEKDEETGEVHWSEQVQQQLGPPSQGFAQGFMQQNPPPQQGPQGMGMGPQPEPPSPLKSQQIPPGLDIQALLKKDLLINVNVGLNATSPDQKLQRLLSAVKEVLAIAANPAHVLFDLEELVKEIFSMCGYGDGQRFMQNGQNPEIGMLRMQLMQLMQAMKMKQPEQANKLQITREKIASNERIMGAKIAATKQETKQKGMEIVLQHAREMESMMRDLEQPQESGGQDTVTDSNGDRYQYVGGDRKSKSSYRKV